MKKKEIFKNVSLNHKGSKMQHPNSQLCQGPAKNVGRNLNPIGFSSVKKKHTAAIQIQTSDKAHTGIRGVKHLL